MDAERLGISVAGVVGVVFIVGLGLLVSSCINKGAAWSQNEARLKEMCIKAGGSIVPTTARSSDTSFLCLQAGKAAP